MLLNSLCFIDARVTAINDTDTHMENMQKLEKYWQHIPGTFSALFSNKYNKNTYIKGKQLEETMSAYQR